MIETKDQQAMSDWLESRTQWVPSRNVRLIGNKASDGRILGVVAYEGWTGTALEGTFAGEPGWLTPRFLWAAFHYPFCVVNCSVLLARIGSKNKESIRLTEKLGFNRIFEIPAAHPDGSLLVYSMYRDSCTWLRRYQHG